jgi:hypothetical protein
MRHRLGWWKLAHSLERIGPCLRRLVLARMREPPDRPC